MDRFRGLLFDGVSPVEQEVFVIIDKGIIKVSSHEPTLSEISLDVSRTTCQLLGKSLVLNWEAPEGEQRKILISDADAVKKAIEVGLLAKSMVDRFGKKKILTFLLLVNITLIFVTYAMMSPISYWLASQISYKQEKKLFQNWALTEMISETCTRPGHKQILDRLAKAILADDYNQVRPDIEIVDLSLVNAFALPGGQIVLTRGLLDKIEREEELTGILAHELVHVANRHVLGEYIRSAFLIAAWSILIGDYTGALVVDPKTARDMLNLSFSRDKEEEADRGAIKRLNQHGFSSQGLGRFFARLKEDENKDAMFELPAIFSSHPSQQSRIDYLKIHGKPGEVSSLSQDELLFLKAACEKVDLKNYQ